MNQYDAAIEEHMDLLEEQVKSLMQRGLPVAAIKLVRRLTGAGLRWSKLYVDQFKPESGNAWRKHFLLDGTSIMQLEDEQRKAEDALMQ